jgi:hypothetical protein
MARVAALVAVVATLAAAQSDKTNVELGPRPYFLVNELDDSSALKRELQSCKVTNFELHRAH